MTLSESNADSYRSSASDEDLPEPRERIRISGWKIAFRTLLVLSIMPLPLLSLYIRLTGHIEARWLIVRYGFWQLLVWMLFFTTAMRVFSESRWLDELLRRSGNKQDRS